MKKLLLIILFSGTTLPLPPKRETEERELRRSPELGERADMEEIKSIAESLRMEERLKIEEDIVAGCLECRDTYFDLSVEQEQRKEAQETLRLIQSHPYYESAIKRSSGNFGCMPEFPHQQ